MNAKTSRRLIKWLASLQREVRDIRLSVNVCSLNVERLANELQAQRENAEELESLDSEEGN